LVELYNDLDPQDIIKKIYIDLHLKPEDELRGAASISDTGLFDFTIR
jgi:hypothetical protein